MTDDPEQLFFTKQDGERGDLHDVIYDGLDHDLSDRVPALERLLAGGSPEHRLYAAAMLAAWGVPSGLSAVAAWARAPEAAPWAADAVTVERFGGADAAFELLADAVRIAEDARGREAVTDAMRADAMRGFLSSFHRVYTGRKLFEIFDLDPALRSAVRDDIGPAVERAIATAVEATFDLQTQAASLLGTLAALDDTRAAAAAEALLAQGPRYLRTTNEIAYSLRFGTGPATLAILERLAASPQPMVRQNAQESLAKRLPS